MGCCPERRQPQQASSWRWVRGRVLPEEPGGGGALPWVWSHLQGRVFCGSCDHDPGWLLRIDVLRSRKPGRCDGLLSNEHLLLASSWGCRDQGPSCLGAHRPPQQFSAEPGCPETPDHVQGTLAAMIPRWAERWPWVSAARAGPRVWIAALGLRTWTRFTTEHESQSSTA